MSLSEARARAIECTKILSAGLDPARQLQLIKDERLQAVTVREALEYWVENYASKKRRNYQKHRAQFKRHIYPHIGDLPLEQCETRHWVKVFDDITSGAFHRAAPVSAGYILQNAKRALKYCRNRQFACSRALEDLTISDIGKHQSKKDRVLSWTELLDVWRWCSDIKSNWYYKNMVRLLVVFGCRTQEVRLSTASEWDLESGLWTVPKEHSKTGSHIVRPIPPQLHSYIASLLAESKSGYLLGELKRAEAVSQWGRGLYAKLGHSKAWTLHDLRRTFATTLNDLEVEPYVVEQLLGHSLGGVMAIYNRSQHIEKKKIALIRWVDVLTDKQVSANVVSFSQ